MSDNRSQQTGATAGETQELAESKDFDQGQGVLDQVMKKPLAALGMAGWFGFVGYGIYNIKNRPKGMPLSLYIIHTRVWAQGIVLGTLSVGMAYALGQRLYKMYKNEPFTEFGEDYQQYVPPLPSKDPVNR